MQHLLKINILLHLRLDEGSGAVIAVDYISYRLDRTKKSNRRKPSTSPGTKMWRLF
ncbi:hypothetical protein [Melghirimyces thermohalophilus]|uniref:hypothetical protein n=1 Tax=Melghirimyces thermohalophilus TaxID=1236220 RepID=UPI0015A2E284